MSTILYWQNEDTGQTESLQFDVVEGETPEDVTTLTDKTVETGSAVSDHARDEPALLTIEGFVSNMVNPELDSDLATEPIELNVPAMTRPGNKTEKLDVPQPPLQLTPTGLLQAGVNAVAGLFTGGPRFTHIDRPRPTSGTVSFSALQQQAPRDRIRDAYEALLTVRKRKLLVTVQQTHREHFDMVITRIAKPKTSESGKGALFQVDLREIRVADSETVQAPQPTEARGKTGVSAGSKNGKADPNAAGKEVVLESTLSQLGTAAGF